MRKEFNILVNALKHIQMDSTISIALTDLDNNGDLRIEFSPHLPHEMASIQSNRTSNLQMQLLIRLPVSLD